MKTDITYCSDQSVIALLEDPSIPRRQRSLSSTLAFTPSNGNILNIALQIDFLPIRIVHEFINRLANSSRVTYDSIIGTTWSFSDSQKFDELSLVPLEMVSGSSKVVPRFCLPQCTPSHRCSRKKKTGFVH